MKEKNIHNVLITGLPGSGKTTLIKKIAAQLREFHPVGFYTEEIRVHGIRQGFAMTSLDLKKCGTLAHVNIKGPHRIGKYGVDLQGFEHFLDSLPLFEPFPRLVIIDEIGKMECLSLKFRDMVSSILDMPASVIATITLRGDDYIDKLKRRPDVILYQLTDRNRDTLSSVIIGGLPVRQNQ